VATTAAKFMASGTLLKKLIIAQLLMKLSDFYGTQVFITVFTRSRYQSYSGPDEFILTLSPYFLKIHFSIILQSTPEFVHSVKLFYE
jgi:hypothetical protein